MAISDYIVTIGLEVHCQIKTKVYDGLLDVLSELLRDRLWL